jgi:hypothetical protein
LSSEDFPFLQKYKKEKKKKGKQRREEYKRRKMSGSGAAEWELEYPCIIGDSSRGGLFEPKELAGELMLQLFTKNGGAHWEPMWCEINGHVFHVYSQKADTKPTLRFDLKG